VDQPTQTKKPILADGLFSLGDDAVFGAGRGRFFRTMASTATGVPAHFTETTVTAAYKSF
jgi:hypothetical protein